MTYTVWYKKNLFWHKLKNIISDGIIENINMRFFINSNNERIEIPTTGTKFKFSRGRQILIEQLEKEKMKG